MNYWKRLVSSTNAFQCYNGDRHPVSAECDGIVDCVGSSHEDEPDSCRKYKFNRKLYCSFRQWYQVDFTNVGKAEPMVEFSKF